MKVQVKGALNAGAHFFIKDKRLHGKLIVQQKPIKDWSAWNNNELFKIRIVPTLFELGKSRVESHLRKFPYLFYINNQLHITADSWQKVLEHAAYRFRLVTEPLGFGTLNIEKQFLKNEPTITFGAVHRILAKAGVSFE